MRAPRPTAAARHDRTTATVAVAILATALAVLTAGCSAAATAPHTGGSSVEPATPTVYRVAVRQCGGADNQRATAVAVAPGLVATVAHSLDRAKSVGVRAADGREVEAEIVHLDAAKDVALLRLPDGAAPLGEPRFTEAAAGDAVAIVTFADEAGPTTKGATVTDLVVATLDGEGRRSALKLDATVEPGDSGAAVVLDGRIAGMVFAAARGQDVGWAVAASELTTAIEAVGDATPARSPRC